MQFLTIQIKKFFDFIKKFRLEQLQTTPGIIVVLIIFLILNAIKSTFFNLEIVDPQQTYAGNVKYEMFGNSLIIFSLLFLLLFRRKSPFWASLLYGFQFFFMTANLTYFYFFQSYLHLNQYFHLWSETVDLMKYSAVPWEPGILVLLIDLPFFVFLVWTYNKIRLFNKTPSYRLISWSPCLLLIIGFARWDVCKKQPILEMMNDRYMSEAQVVKQHGIFMFNLASLLKLSDNRNMIEQLNRGEKISRPADSTSTKPNVIVLQIESMDANIINRKHQGRYITPYLHSLTRKAVYYPYVLSYHLAGSTSDCEFSCINGVEPLDNFPSIKIRNYSFPNSMAKRFSENGYDVAVFHGNRGEYFNRTIAFRKMGFGAFYDMHAMGLNHVGWGAPDHEVLGFTKKILDTAKEPFFYYIITMSTHEPFTFTKTYFDAPQFKAIKEDRVRNYFTCMAYADHTIKEYVGFIRRKFPNTVIAIYGDHTPGMRKNSYQQSSTRHDDMNFEFVPMFILTPDNKIRHEKKCAVSFVDIAPTLLNITGSKYQMISYGADLLKDSVCVKPVHFRGKEYSRSFLFNLIRNSRIVH